MESTESPLTIKINYVVHAPIKRIEWRNHPDGWFIQFEGSWESLNFGIEHPQWEIGDIVKITFEKQDGTDNALLG